MTLGLSPWSERDWTADAGPLTGGVPDVATEDLDRTASFLTRREQAFAEEVARGTGVPNERALAALDALCVHGRVLYDPGTDLFFPRRLFTRDPPAPPAPHERRAAGAAIAARGGVAISRDALEGRTRVLQAVVRAGGPYAVTAVLDEAGRLARGACACPFFARFGLQRGACKHLLAVATKIAEP